MKELKGVVLHQLKSVEVIDIIEVNKELIEQAKEKSIILKKEKNIKQELVFDKQLVLRESYKELTKDYNLKNSELDVFLKDGDKLIKTERGYQKVALPMKMLSKNEINTIEKYNKFAT